jgi:hypothetical protein
MKIKNYCIQCHGTGHVVTHDPYAPPSDITCPYCNGLGYTTTDIIGDELTGIIDKIDATQAYLETLRTDLTTALTAIWNKVKNLP